METTAEFTTEFGLQRLWGRRLTGGNILEEDLAGLLEDPDLFPSAQLEVNINQFFFLEFVLRFL